MAAVSTENLKELAFAINRSVGESIKAGAEAVIIPERQKFLADIKRDLETGQVDRVENVVEKLSNVIGEMKDDFKQYGDILNTDLVNNLKELVESKKDADQEVIQLQKQNISAHTQLIEKDKQISYQAVVLTNKELRAEKDRIYKEERDIVKDEKQLQKDIKDYQNSDIRNDEVAKELADRQLALIKRQEKNEDKRNKLQIEKSKSFLDELSENVPSGIKDMFSSFTDTLKAPIEAFKGVGRIFVNLGKGIGQIVKLFGTLAKGLARMLLSVLAATAGFLASALPFLLIGGLIIALGYGLKKLIDKLDIFGDDSEKREEIAKKQAQDSSDRSQEIQDVQDERLLKQSEDLSKELKEKQDELANLDEEYENMPLYKKMVLPDKATKKAKLENQIKGIQERQYQIKLRRQVLEMIEQRRADGETVAGGIPTDIGQLTQMIETGGLMPHEMADRGITPVEKGTMDYPNIIYQQNDNSTKSKNNANVSAGVSIINPEQTAYRAAFEGSH